MEHDVCCRNRSAGEDKIGEPLVRPVFTGRCVLAIARDFLSSGLSSMSRHMYRHTEIKILQKKAGPLLVSSTSARAFVKDWLYRLMEDELPGPARPSWPLEDTVPCSLSANQNVRRSLCVSGIHLIPLFNAKTSPPLPEGPGGVILA